MSWDREKSEQCNTYFDKIPKWLESLIASDESLAHLRRKKDKPPYLTLRKRKGRRDHNDPVGKRNNRRNTGAGHNGQSRTQGKRL